MGGGLWLLVVLGLGWAGYMVALAAGRARIGPVRDARDALQGRWLAGGMTIGIGFLLALTGHSLPAWVIGAILVLSGGAVIHTARLRAPFDPTNRVSEHDISQAARGFVFDSRPPARGAIEAHSGRWWTAFVVVIAVLFSGLLVGMAVWTFTDGPAQLPARLAFLVGSTVFFVVVLIGPSIWWMQRVVRGIPMVRIDSYGITLGRHRTTDLSMAWDDMQAIEVRMMDGGGIRDHLLIVHPGRSGWLGEQPRRWRIYARVSRALFGGHFAISTIALTVSLPELLARIAAYRPSLLSSESPELSPGAGCESSSG